MSVINKSQKKYLKNIVQKNALVHAYLFCGPRGTGKADILIDFICQANNISNKDIVRDNQHPDVIIVRQETVEKGKKIKKKLIGIDQVKKAMEKAQYYSYQSRFKFVVILEAENMTDAAANSILKFIEEPSKDTIICLIANNEDRVIPTIRSRCQPIRFGLQSIEVIENELEVKFSDKQADYISECAQLSHGRFDFAVNYCENEELIKIVKNHQNIFRKALRGGVLEGLALSEKICPDQVGLMKVMDEWIWYLRSFVRELIEKSEDPRVIRKVFCILSATISLKTNLEYENTNAKIQLDNFFVQLS